MVDATAKLLSFRLSPPHAILDYAGALGPERRKEGKKK